MGAYMIWVAFFDKLHPPLHRIPAVPNDGLVAKLLPRGPGNNHARISPAWRAQCKSSTQRSHAGRRIAKSTFRSLIVDHVAHPFVAERRNIGVVGACTPENLRVAHPTQTFIALRAIGGDAQEIAPLAPQSHLPHPI